MYIFLIHVVLEMVPEEVDITGLWILSINKTLLLLMLHCCFLVQYINAVFLVITYACNISKVIVWS